MKNTGWLHTSYLLQMQRIISVGQTFSCGAILFHMNHFDGHVEQNYFTWQAIVHHMIKLLVVWNNLSCGAMTNCSWYQIVIHVTYLQCMISCGDLCCFDAKSMLSQFTHFLKINPQILSMEQKWQIWCLSLSRTCSALLTASLVSSSNLAMVAYSVSVSPFKDCIFLRIASIFELYWWDWDIIRFRGALGFTRRKQ